MGAKKARASRSRHFRLYIQNLQTCRLPNRPPTRNHRLSNTPPSHPVSISGASHNLAPPA
eukprot:3922816-Amphidinium_carterae.1